MCPPFENDEGWGTRFRRRSGKDVAELCLCELAGSARAAGSGGSVMELVVVAGVDAQSELGRGFRVSGDELVFVMIEEEIKRILRIHVEQSEVGVVHGELAEADIVVAIGHVVPSFPGSKRSAGNAAVFLNDVVALQPNASDLPANVRGGKDLLGVENEIIFVGGEAFDFPGIDQLGDVESEQVEQTFHRHMGSLHVAGVKADAAI